MESWQEMMIVAVGGAHAKGIIQPEEKENFYQSIKSGTQESDIYAGHKPVSITLRIETRLDFALANRKAKQEIKKMKEKS